MTPYERIAAELADLMLKCQSVEQLDAIRKHVQKAFDNDPVFKAEYGEWLRTTRDGIIQRLNWPQKPIEEILNKEGLKHYEKPE